MANIRYFEWVDGIYIAFCNEVFVILDIFSDNYLALDEEPSKALRYIISNSFYYDSNQYDFLENEYIFDKKYINYFIDFFIKNNIIKQTNNHKRNNKIAVPLKLGGLHQTEWFLKPINYTKIDYFLVCKSFKYLILVQYIIRTKKIHGIIDYLKKIKNKNTIRNESFKMSCKFAESVSMAAFFFPIQTVCLHYASALSLLHFSKSYNCSFKIGVQNTPFYAHAWVESESRIVNDNDELKEKLAIIYELS